MNIMRGWVVLLLFSGCDPAMFAQQIGPKEFSPTVVGIVGNWTANPTSNPRTLRFGSAIASDDRISGSSRGGSILVTSRKADKDYRFFEHCDQLPCEYNFRDENRPVEAAGFFARLWAAVIPVIQGHGDAFVAAVSREWGQDLREAVTPLQGGQLDLTAAIESLDPGSYFVRLERLGTSAQPGRALPLQWAPGAPARFSSAGVSPGLHKLLLVRDNGDPTGVESWILIAAPADYDRFASDFRQAMAATASLAQQMDADATRPVLRAYLKSLADSSRPR